MINFLRVVSCLLLVEFTFSCAAKTGVKPILHFSFDDQKQPMFDDIGNHEAQIKKTDLCHPQWVPNGKFGGALYFDGKDDFVRIKDAADLNFGPNDSFTVEAWVKPEPESSSSIGSIVNKGSVDYWDLRYHSKTRLGCFLGKNRRSYKIFLNSGNSAGKWQHVAMVRDADEHKIRFYLGGILLQEKNAPDEDEFFNIKGADLFLGKFGRHLYRGIIDELVISKGAKRRFNLQKRPLADGSATLETKYKPADAKLEEPDTMVAASWAVLKKYRLNIVPSPKEIKVTGEAMEIFPEQWCFELKSDRLKTGMAFFNKRLKLVGGKGLNDNSEMPNRIIVGNFDDLSRELAQIGNPEKPPRQGYVIGCFTENGASRVVVAGTDRIGTLYGCVTLGLALKKGKARPFLYSVSVRDWPDFTYRVPDFHISRGKFNLSDKKQMIDRAFALKFNMLEGTSLYTIVPDLIKNAGKIREYFRYAEERGIRLLILNHTSVALAPRFNPKTMPGYSKIYYPYKTREGLLADSHYGSGRAFTWCRDDLIEKRGRQLNETLNRIGGNSIYLHSMDCGGRDNPNNWNYRTPMDKKRWGNDRAAADANLGNILYRNMAKDHPELIMIVVEYPYGAYYLKYPDIIKWLKRYGELLNLNIYFGLRECERKYVEQWISYTGERPYFFYLEPSPVRQKQFFCCMARYARTFYFKNRKKDIFALWSNSTLKRSLEPQTMIVSEYAWNTEAPGWGWFPEDAKSITRIDEQVPRINEELLPRALAIFYGEQAAPYIARALSTCLSGYIAVNQAAFKGATFAAYFKAKTKAGKYAVANLEQAAPLVIGEEQAEFRKLFSLVKAAAALNEAKGLQLQARDALAEGDIEKAQEFIGEAKRILHSIVVSEVYKKRWVDELLKELDIAKNIAWYRTRKKHLEKVGKLRIRVGVFNYGWYKGVSDSLNNAAGMQTGLFEDPQPKYIRNFDVLIFNACRDTGDVYGDWRKAVCDFAKNGGVVIFSHNAIGRYPSSGFGKQIFPEICAGYGGQQVGEPELTVKASIDGVFNPGDKYIHGYYDHLIPKQGKNAEILMVNKYGKPVVVGGKVGKGYVIYTGEIFGVNKKDASVDLTGDNWKMLFHMIRYAKNQCQ